MVTDNETGVRPRSIVVGVVDDRCSGSLAYALRLALEGSAKIRVVRVAASSHASRVAMRLPVHTVEAVGDPLEILVDESRGADLLVVETPRDTREAAGDPLLTHLRRQTETLMVEVDHAGDIVRASGPEGGAYAAEPDLRFAVPPADPVAGRTICVGVDSSPASNAAVAWASVMAARTSSALQLVSVYDGDSAGSLRTEHDARSDIAAAVALVGGPAPGSVVVRGEPAEGLMDASRGSDMLVLGRHSTRGLIHGALGSVGGTCARLAACPVVIVPYAPRRD